MVKIGFATVSPIDTNLEKDQYYVKYYKNLLSAERKAELKGVGVWYNNKLPLYAQLINRFKSMLPYWVI